MKSKASIKTHPIHPILVVFPIAFFIGAFFFDMIGVFTSDRTFEVVAVYLEMAGIFATMAAAIPGIVDYIYSVPPKSSAKKRALKHGVLNIVMLILFTLAYFTHGREEIGPETLILEAIGVGILMVSGWMGGTLVHRNQIGVYNRYANGGKWKEEYISAKEDVVKVAISDEFKEDQIKLIHYRDQRIVVGKTKGRYVAYEDRCTHKGGSLAGGTMICGKVQCPWHGSQFDTFTGEVNAGPAKQKIRVFPVIEKAGELFIDFSSR